MDDGAMYKSHDDGFWADWDVVQDPSARHSMDSTSLNVVAATASRHPSQQVIQTSVPKMRPHRCRLIVSFLERQMIAVQEEESFSSMLPIFQRFGTQKDTRYGIHLLFGFKDMVLAKHVKLT
jgi:hypothetical protein